MQWWPAYLAIGLAVGFFAGLLGIGGGAVMVPMLVLVFTAQGLPADHIMHIALGTAMATGILAGSFCAALAAGLIARRRHPVSRLVQRAAALGDRHRCRRGLANRPRRYAGLRLAGSARCSTRSPRMLASLW